MEFIKKNFGLIFVITASLVCLLLSSGHIANVYIDVGREVYYPSRILEGKVLYKDLFCIYGPFAYLINAFFYKIFGQNLNTLYALGILSGTTAISFTYLISKKFLNEYYSLICAFFVIVSGCLSTRIFNFVLPYSYAVLYGLVFFVLSLYFLLKFIDDNKQKNIIISSIFAGLSIVCKYDFILYLIPFFIVLFKTKDVKIILKSAFSLILAMIFPFAILFIQGLSFNDLINSLILIKNFTNTYSLRQFYLTQGVYYNHHLWAKWAEILLGHLFHFVLILIGILTYKKIKILGAIIALYGSFTLFLNTDDSSYLPLTFVCVLLFFAFLVKNSFKENILILSALLVGLKSLWGLGHVNYGLYYLPLILISFFVLIKRFKLVSVVFSLMFISMGLFYLSGNINSLNNLSYKINTGKGYLRTFSLQSKDANGLIAYINETNKENPSIGIFPEGLMMNFLADKKNVSDDFYNSLIPLYVEGLGEDNIIKHYKKHPLDYIIFTNQSMSDYGYNQICTTYAKRFCNYVMNNYKLDKIITNEENIFTVFKKE